MNQNVIAKGLKLLFTQPGFLLKYLFPGRTSYSQTGEDLILDLFFHGKKEGFYIDIGANHPARLSNTLLFYKRGWNGINIEPNVTLHKAFLKMRKRDVNLNIGVGPDSGSSLDFYVIQPDTLSTFDAASAKQYEAEGHSIVSVEKVPIISLDEVFGKYVGEKHVDFISIDTEGYDMQVLQSNDWKKNRPDFIILETLEYKRNGNGEKLNATYDEFFESHKYSKYADTYINTIYVSSEAMDTYKISM